MNLTGQERFVLKGPLRNNGVGQLLAGEDLANGARIAMRKMPLEAMGALAVEAVEALPRHEALPRVVASGRDDLLAWVALEFPQGSLLSVEAMPLEHGLWLKVATKVAAALAAGHAAGIVHGELSTDSVLLTDDRVLLFDLPLVVANRLTDRRGEARELAMLAQTVTYLSIERAKGSGPTEASDVYALAVMMCLAGGAEAVPGATALERMHRIVSEAWKPELPGRVPEAHELLSRMLSTEPKARPSMLQVVEALQALKLEETHDEAREPVEHPSPAPAHDPFEELVAKGVSVNAPDPHAVPTRQMDPLELQAQQKKTEPHATAPRPAPLHVINKARRTPQPQPALRASDDAATPHDGADAVPLPAQTAPASPPVQPKAPSPPPPSLAAWLPPSELPGAPIRWSDSLPPVATGLTSPEMAAVGAKPLGTMPSMEAIADAMIDAANAPKTSENPVPLPFPSIPPPVATTPPLRAREPVPAPALAGPLPPPLPTAPPVAREPLRLPPPMMIGDPTAPLPAAVSETDRFPAAVEVAPVAAVAAAVDSGTPSSALRAASPVGEALAPAAAKTVTDLPAALPKSLTDTDRQDVLPQPMPTAPFGSPAATAQGPVMQVQLPPPLPTAPATRRPTPNAGPVKNAAREAAPLPPGVLSWISANNQRLIGSVAIALCLVLLGLSLFSELMSRRSQIAELTQAPKPADIAKQKADRLKQPQTKQARAAAMRDSMKGEKTDDEY